MKFKNILPYLLFGSLVLLPKGVQKFHNTDYSLHARQTFINDGKDDLQKTAFDKKAKDLCDIYIDFVLQGQKNIKNGRGGHRKSVLREFPGAYTRWYCIYGQYVQLNRALSELGDTLNLIPFDGRHSCPEFRRLMKQKYSNEKYAGALHSGKMYRSDAAYHTALRAYLKHNHIDESTPDSVRQKFINRFARDNFSVESLHPGTILIYQKSATPSNTHAVMFLGRGRVQNEEFIPDEKGKFLYAGYNNESIEDVFGIYNTNRMFAADIFCLATIEYQQEFDKIQNMNNWDLFRFVYDVPNNTHYATVYNRQQLLDMARDKYFDKKNFVAPQQNIRVNTASFPIAPGTQFLQNKLGKTK